MTEASREAVERLDDAARAAASAPAGSLLLEAPAGSGKTSVLTRRFLELLCTVDDPGEILAITFTRKAAAEMRARIVRALRGEFDPGDPERDALAALADAALAHGARRGWQLAREPQRLRIETIDAFNHALAAQLPVASRACGVLDVTEDAGGLYARAARETLADAESDPQLGQDAGLLFERLDNRWLTLEKLISEMLAVREHWLPVILRAPPQRLCEIVDATLAAHTRAQLAALCARVPATLRARAGALPGCGPLGAEPADLAHWQHLAHLCLTRSDLRQQLRAATLGAAFADAALRATLRALIAELQTVAGLREALEAVRRAPPAELPAADAAALVALARLLTRAAAALHAEFARTRRVDYAYVAGAARQALTEGGEPTDLGLRTGLALRHILVDEFQDTSLTQVELLTALTAGWERGDGRTLFVVGDPMQSIYRFRQAEVGRFLAARRAGIGSVPLEALQLTRNFRAAPELVAFVNATFAAIFPRADDPESGAVAYRASLAARAPRALPAGIDAVSLRLFPGDRYAEAQAVAARIEALRALEPQAGCAVLVVAHAHARPVIEALEARGIPVLGVDLVPLGERPVVRDLEQLARALADPADRIAWLAVLRAPWCGVKLPTLAALSTPGDPELLPDALANPARLARCDAADRPRLKRVRRVLAGAVALRDRLPVADALELTWLRLGGADACTRAELTDARAFFAALAAHSAAGDWQGPRDFPQLLARLYSTPEPVPGAVQVMTIHRAKGLEFDHVFVPGLERTTRSGGRRLLRWIELPQAPRGSDLLMAPTRGAGVAQEGVLEAYIAGLERDRDAHEQLRLLYVAATRARRTLWLSGAPRPAADGTLRPDRRSLLGRLWPALETRFTRATPGASPPAVAARPAGLRRLVAGWEPGPVPASLHLAPPVPPAYLGAEPLEFSWADRTVRDIGTVVHAALARYAQAREVPDAATPVGEGVLLRAQLARLGVPEAELDGSLAEVVEALTRTLTDARGRWLLASHHREAYSEWELSGVADGSLRTVKIDRSFIADGVRWVVDYKTSRHEGGDLEAFLKSELERYRPQLAGYRALGLALGPEPVRAALYFPLLGAFRELA